MNNIHLYQRLRTITNEFVTIVKIEENTITVRYKGKSHERPKNIIGRKLFVCKEDENCDEPSTDKIKKNTCDDCMMMRNGECFGAKEICEFFKYAPTISKEEMDSWPEYGDALSYRFDKRDKNY